MNTPVWIGLGSNLGDRKGLLDAAVGDLRDTPGVVVRAVSGYHETQPVGGPPGQGPFLNAAAHLETTLDPHQLLAVMKEIEHQAGRVRTVRWGERTLDLDILIFGTKFLDTKDLKLPHPRLAFRRFVLASLAEIAPNIVDTTNRRTIADLLANLDRRPRLLALHGNDRGVKSAVFRRLVEELPGFGIAEEDMVAPSDPVNDPFPGFLETLGQKVEVLRANHWAIENLRGPWIVADYSLDLDFIRAMSMKWRWINDPSRAELSTRKMSVHNRLQQIQVAAKDAIQPTLVVILPGDEEMRRRPGRRNVPQLWPESDEPDAIAAEVLATCRGISEV